MDYTKSAVGLTNPDALKVKLNLLANELKIISELQITKGNLAIKSKDLQVRIESVIPPELRLELIELEEQENNYILMENQSQELAANITQEIKEYCETNNVSYQDLNAGYWAIKQKKETVTYLPNLVKTTLPENVAAMVIVEAVDPDKMAGMIKGKFVTAEDARACAKIETKYNYIVKVEAPAKEGK